MNVLTQLLTHLVKDVTVFFPLLNSHFFSQNILYKILILLFGTSLTCGVFILSSTYFVKNYFFQFFCLSAMQIICLSECLLIYLFDLSHKMIALSASLFFLIYPFIRLYFPLLLVKKRAIFFRCPQINFAIYLQ